MRNRAIERPILAREVGAVAIAAGPNRRRCSFSRLFCAPAPLRFSLLFSAPALLRLRLRLCWRPVVLLVSEHLLQLKLRRPRQFARVAHNDSYTIYWLDERQVAERVARGHHVKALIREPQRHTTGVGVRNVDPVAAPLQERFAVRVEGNKVNPDPRERLGVVTAVILLVRVEAIESRFDDLALPPVSLDSEVTRPQDCGLLGERRRSDQTY